MRQQEDVAAQAPEAPTLVAPRQGEDVPAEAVTFDWLAVDGATAYWLEISTDGAFNDVVFSTDAGEATTHTVEDLDPEEETYYWRVRARRDRTWGPYSQAEPFGATPEPVDTVAIEVERPEQQEDLGPAAELFKASGKEAAAEASGHREEVEAEGVEAGQILGFVVATAVTLVLLVVTLFILTGRMAEGTREALTTEAEYPDLRETELEAARQLGQYEVLDAEEGVYRIPIDRAINLMVDEYYQQGEERAYSSEVQLPRGN